MMRTSKVYNANEGFYLEKQGYSYRPMPVSSEIVNCEFNRQPNVHS